MIDLVVDPRDAETVPLGESASGNRPFSVDITTSRPVRLAAGGFMWDGAGLTRGTTDEPVRFTVPATDGPEVHADDRGKFSYVVTVRKVATGQYDPGAKSRTFTGLLPSSLGATVQVTDLVPAEPPGPLTPGQYAEIDARLDALEAGGGGGGGAVASVNAKTGVVVLNAADVGAAPALGSDDNYVTDAEKVKLGSLSGTNTGDQVLPTWASISGKPAVVAAGADQAAARSAIGAGTSSLALGSTGSTAAAGNHGHAAAAISDLTEAVQDIAGAFIVAGVGVTVSYDDAAGTFTINATGGGGGSTDPEIVRDVIGTALVAGAGVQITVNDAGDSITIASTAVLPSRTVTAGTGLTGGGDLSANRTLAVDFTVVSAKAHSHWADDVVRGGGAPLDTDVLGNGTADATKYLAGDSTWQALTAAAVSDSTATGRALLTAADAAAARTATGAAAASHTHGVTDLTATGTKDATTFLRGDNTWAVPAGGGGAVDSVNGETGAVVLDAADVGAATTGHTHTQASTTVVGPVELATVAEATTGTDTVRAVTPAGVKAVADTKAALSHTHTAADVNAGTLDVARLGSGTPAAGKYVDGGTGAWTTLPAGGGGGSGVDDFTPHVAGMWRTPLNVAGAPGIEPAGMSGIACFSPLVVTKASASFTDLGINVTTAGGAGAVARMGIFNLTDKYNIAGGGSLRTDFGTVAVTSTGWKQATAGSPAVLTPGVYLLCVWHSVDSAFRVDAINNPSGGRWSAPSASFGVADPGGGRMLAGWYKSSVDYSAGLPSTVASLNGASAGIQAVTCIAAKMG